MRFDYVKISTLCIDFAARQRSRIFDVRLTLVRVYFIFSMPVSDTEKIEIRARIISAFLLHSEPRAFYTPNLEYDTDFVRVDDTYAALIARIQR